MQQHEAIQEALRYAPPSPAEIDPPAEKGEKVIDPATLGDVDVEVIAEWVEANGGRVLRSEAEGGVGGGARVLLVIAEAALAL